MEGVRQGGMEQRQRGGMEIDEKGERNRIGIR